VPDLTAALNRLLARRGHGPLDRAEVSAMIGDGVRALVRRALAARSEAVDEAALAAFIADYEDNSTVQTRPFEGVEQTLGIFAEAGWRLAVCTNKPTVATRALLDALGLSHWFAAIGAGDSFATRKPDPGHVLATLAAAGGDIESAIMVGDHANDVLAATAAGAPCIFAAWGYGPAAMAAGAAAIAERFADLPALAEMLLGLNQDDRYRVGALAVSP